MVGRRAPPIIFLLRFLGIPILISLSSLFGRRGHYFVERSQIVFFFFLIFNLYFMLPLYENSDFYPPIRGVSARIISKGVYTLLLLKLIFSFIFSSSKQSSTILHNNHSNVVIIHLFKASYCSVFAYFLNFNFCPSHLNYFRVRC